MIVFVSTFPTQSLRGLHGLGSTSELTAAKAQFESTMRQLVDGVKQRCAQMVNEANFTTRKIVVERTTRVVENVTSGTNSLKKVDAKGVPLFLRKPQDAQRLLLVIKENADEELSELQKDLGAFFFSSGQSLAGLLQAFINQLVEALLLLLETIAKALGQAFVKFPIGGLVLLGGTALALYFKFGGKGRAHG